jgi:hypothetical protein
VFQADLLGVLDEFAIKSPLDFYKLPPGRKTYCIRRLYKAFADNEEDAVGDLLSAGGVKLHFATSGDLTVPNTNLPSAPFLKKLCFYSNRTLITFPFERLSNASLSRALKGVPAKAWRNSMKRENSPLLFGHVVSGRNGYGGYVGLAGGEGYSLDPAAFADFLQVISQIRPAIDAGLTYLLPAFPDKKKEFRRLSKRLISANFKLEELNRQFMESELSNGPGFKFEGDLLNLYLPYFTGIPIERILEIRSQQQDMYNDFQRYLENLLYGLSAEETEVKFLGVLRDIDSGIRELEKKFRSVKGDYNRKDIYMGIGVLCTGLAMFAGLEWGKDIAQLVAGATGTATGIQFTANMSEKRKAQAALADDRFYLPWLIHKEAPSISDS